MNFTNKRLVIPAIKYFAFVLIAAALLIFAFKGIRLKDIEKQIVDANIIWVSLSVILSFIALVSRAYRWKLLIETLGYFPKIQNTFYSLMVGYLANLAFPRMGEITRCGSIAKKESIPFDKLLGTVIVERVVDLISLLICLLLAFIIEFKRLGNFLMESIFHPFIRKFEFLSSGIAIMILISVLIATVLAIFYFRARYNRNNKGKLIQIAKGLWAGLQSIGRLQKPWIFILHSLFIWTLYFFSTYISFKAMPSTSHLGLNVALFVLVIGGLGMSAPVQGGIGIYHLLVSNGLLLYGLTQQDGLAFATLVHASQTLMVIFLGAVSLFLLFLANRSSKKQLEEIPKQEPPVIKNSLSSSAHQSFEQYD
jgi:uncharacterized protein (TIRG00374 family)